MKATFVGFFFTLVPMLVQIIVSVIRVALSEELRGLVEFDYLDCWCLVWTFGFLVFHFYVCFIDGRGTYTRYAPTLV